MVDAHWDQECVRQPQLHSAALPPAEAAQLRCSPRVTLLVLQSDHAALQQGTCDVCPETAATLLHVSQLQHTLSSIPLFLTSPLPSLTIGCPSSCCNCNLKPSRAEPASSSGLVRSSMYMRNPVLLVQWRRSTSCSSPA